MGRWRAARKQNTAGVLRMRTCVAVCGGRDAAQVHIRSERDASAVDLHTRTGGSCSTVHCSNRFALSGTVEARPRVHHLQRVQAAGLVGRRNVEHHIKAPGPAVSRRHVSTHGAKGTALLVRRGDVPPLRAAVRAWARN